MKTTRANKKGFTLVEIVLVVAVITVLSAVAIFNVGSSIQRYKEHASLIADRNNSYGWFEPNAQYETHQRLLFREYIEEIRAADAEAQIVVPENAEELGDPPGNDGDNNGDNDGQDGNQNDEQGGDQNGEQGGDQNGEQGGDQNGEQNGGQNGDQNGGQQDEQQNSGSNSSLVQSVTVNGNRMNITLGSGGNSLDLTVTRNGDSYRLSGCTAERQWILQGNDTFPGMPGFSWGTPTYDLTGDQISWFNSTYGIDVTQIGEGSSGGGNSGNGGTTAPAETTPAAPAGTSLNVSAGGTTSNGVYNITAVSGTTVSLQQSNNTGNTVEVRLSLNADGTYHMVVTGGNKYILDQNSGNMFDNNGVHFWAGNEFDLNSTLTSYFTNTLGIRIQ